MTATTAQSTQVYSIFIKATPEQVWDAITKPEFTQKYFHDSRLDFTNGYRSVAGDGRLLVSGELFELDPPRRLVHGWRSHWDDRLAAEPESRVTWEIEPRDDGTSLLTVTHDRLEDSPLTAATLAGGWMLVLNGLKALVETGEAVSS